ncbi:MAG: hypothetical protein ABTD50_21570 [Polyangiaceae bacterium]|jgi:hypothetical protein
MSDPRPTFVERALSGEVLDVEESVDDAIDEWHERSGRLDDGRRVAIFDWLGMTREEYRLFVERPDALETILMAHRHGLSVTDLLKLSQSGSTSIAARSAPKDLGKLTAWLKQTGRL